MYCNDIVQCTRFPPEMQPKQPGSRCFRAVQAIEKVRWTFSTAFTMPRFFVCFAVQKAAAARRKRLLPQAFCRHSIQHEGAPQHRRGSTVCRPVWPANPLVLPQRNCTHFLQTEVFRQAERPGSRCFRAVAYGNIRIRAAWRPQRNIWDTGRPCRAGWSASSSGGT